MKQPQSFAGSWWYQFECCLVHRPLKHRQVYAICMSKDAAIRSSWPAGLKDQSSTFQLVSCAAWNYKRKFHACWSSMYQLQAPPSCHLSHFSISGGTLMLFRLSGWNQQGRCESAAAVCLCSLLIDWCSLNRKAGTATQMPWASALASKLLVHC